MPDIFFAERVIVPYERLSADAKGSAPEHKGTCVPTREDENQTRRPRGPALLDTVLNDVESRFIERALELTANNRSQAAHLLGVGRSTLCMKMKRLGIKRPPTRATK